MQRNANGKQCQNWVMPSNAKQDQATLKNTKELQGTLTNHEELEGLLASSFEDDKSLLELQRLSRQLKIAHTIWGFTVVPN